MWAHDGPVRLEVCCQMQHREQWEWVLVSIEDHMSQFSFNDTRDYWEQDTGSAEYETHDVNIMSHANNYERSCSNN